MTTRAHYKKYLPQIAGGTLVVAVLAGLIAFIQHMLNSSTPIGKKAVQQITLLQPPPPPPPPPKVEEPPPEPEVVEDKTPDPDPQQTDNTADDVPPGTDLGLDADGGAGGDLFGLVGRKGGRDLIGSRGSMEAWYANVIKSDVQDLLYEDPAVRKKRYAVDVRFWIDPEGHVKRFELLRTSGDRDMDGALKTALRNFSKVRERPPEELPRSFTIRITSRL